VCSLLVRDRLRSSSAALRAGFDYCLGHALVNAVLGVARRRVLCHHGARMLSKLHEALRLLFSDRPTLAPEILRDALKPPLPDFTEIRIESSDLTEAVPRELRADHVVGLYNGAERVLSIIVEPQLKSPDTKKLRAWVGYVSGSFIRHRCQACLLVVTTHRAVA